MIETFVRAASFDCGGRPHEKLILLLLAMSEGTAGESFPVTEERLAHHSELSTQQVMAVLNDLERRSVIWLDATVNPLRVALTL